MYVDLVSLRDVKILADDTLVISYQLSDAPDELMKGIIESWPHPSHHRLTVEGSVLTLTVTGGAQNAAASAQWLALGRGEEGPPFPAMQQRYEQLAEIRERLFDHIDGLMRSRP